jgi:hypothetical protein
MGVTDQPQAATSSGAASLTTVYSERLTTPVWWWPVCYVVLGPIAYELHMAVRSMPVWVAYLVLIWVPAWVLLWLGRHKVEVTVASDESDTVASDAQRPDPADVELRVGRAHLPTNFVATTAIVPPSAKSAALGRQLDPAAFVSHRPWIGPMVLLVLDDPDDPTPYWLISTRRPERLLAALGRADAAAS